MTSRVQHPMPRVHSLASSVRSPGSSVQSQHPTLASRVQEFWYAPPEVFLGKSFLKICSKFTGELSCRSATSIKLLCNFIRIALHHAMPCSVNLLHIFRTPFHKNTSAGLLLNVPIYYNAFRYFIAFVTQCWKAMK